jgi:uncharacterized lipoprotein
MRFTSHVCTGTVNTSTMKALDMYNIAKTTLAAALIAALSSCASEPVCDYDDEPYMAANSVPALQAPPGLTTPDRSAALTIPPPAEGAPTKPSGKGRCLDRPPSYFQTAPKTDAASSESGKSTARDK